MLTTHKRIALDVLGPLWSVKTYEWIWGSLGTISAQSLSIYEDLVYHGETEMVRKHCDLSIVLSRSITWHWILRYQMLPFLPPFLTLFSNLIWISKECCDWKINREIWYLFRQEFCFISPFLVFDIFIMQIIFHPAYFAFIVLIRFAMQNK